MRPLIADCWWKRDLQRDKLTRLDTARAIKVEEKDEEKEEKEEEKEEDI